MKHIGKRNSSCPKTKGQWWNEILVWGVIVFIGITILGCEKENGTNNSDEYYVKYEVNSTTIYSQSKQSVTISAEDNKDLIFTVEQGTDWETVIGPVKKGFTATLKVVAITETYNKLRLYTSIYVSKNDSPFALKVNDGSDTPRDSVQISYTIDY